MAIAVMPIATMAISASICVADFECDISNPDHFPAVNIDDLLVQQIPAHPQHVLVGVIGCKVFLAQPDSIERNGSNLVVADRQPGPAAAHQETVDPGRMDQ